MAALIGFRSPRGPRGRQPGGLEFASRGASRLRGVFSSFLSPPLSLSLFFNSSPPPLLTLFHHPTRGHLALYALSHADKAFRKGGTPGAKLQRNEFRLHIRRIAFLRPVSCPRTKCPPSSLAARTFSSLRFATLRRFFSLSPFCPTIGRQIPR